VSVDSKISVNERLEDEGIAINGKEEVEEMEIVGRKVWKGPSSAFP